MGVERRFPCPFCGAEFHYTPDEPRLKVPCPKCGKKLTMPHGSFDTRFVTGGIGIDGDGKPTAPVFGMSPGLMTEGELHESMRRNATWWIRRWEELRAKGGAGHPFCRAVELEVYWALWSFPAKSFVLDGKRYKGISRVNGLTVRVTPAPQKKGKRRPSQGAEE
jgi:hypothetical protein